MEVVQTPQRKPVVEGWAFEVARQAFEVMEIWKVLRRIPALMMVELLDEEMSKNQESLGLSSRSYLQEQHFVDADVVVAVAFEEIPTRN